jgi:hypothetical protein
MVIIQHGAGLLSDTRDVMNERLTDAVRHSSDITINGETDFRCHDS